MTILVGICILIQNLASNFTLIAQLLQILMLNDKWNTDKIKFIFIKCSHNVRNVSCNMIIWCKITRNAFIIKLVKMISYENGWNCINQRATLVLLFLFTIWQKLRYMPGNERVREFHKIHREKFCFWQHCRLKLNKFLALYQNQLKWHLITKESRKIKIILCFECNECLCIRKPQNDFISHFCRRFSFFSGIKAFLIIIFSSIT